MTLRDRARAVARGIVEVLAEYTPAPTVTVQLGPASVALVPPARAPRPGCGCTAQQVVATCLRHGSLWQRAPKS